MIQQHFKKCGTLAESACMFKFLELLRSVYRYDREKFQCELGVGPLNDFFSLVKLLKKNILF